MHDSLSLDWLRLENANKYNLQFAYWTVQCCPWWDGWNTAGSTTGRENGPSGRGYVIIVQPFTSTQITDEPFVAWLALSRLTERLKSIQFNFNQIKELRNRSQGTLITKEYTPCLCLHHSPSAVCESWCGSFEGNEMLDNKQSVYVELEGSESSHLSEAASRHTWHVSVLVRCPKKKIASDSDVVFVVIIWIELWKRKNRSHTDWEQARRVWR